MSDSSRSQNRHISMIGLGLMGSRMSANLRAAGFEVRGYDIDPNRRDEFAEAGGIACHSPAEAVRGCWAVVLSLPTSDVSREVCFGSQGLAEAGPDPLFIFDTTTGPPDDAVSLAAELANHGVVYSDTTVSGNGEIAGRGELIVMMGGSVEAYRLGSPIFDAIGRAHHHVGPVGSGARMKLIVNHVLSINRLALAEGLVVAELGDMDLEKTLEILKDGAAYSRAMDLWGDRMVNGDHDVPFARLRQTHKDSRLIVQNGIDLGAPTDLVSVVLAALTEGMEGGLADYDNSAVIEVLRRRAGIGRVE